jgi:hypothetical protein
VGCRVCLQAVRLEALALLRRLTRLPYATLHPYRASVAMGLAPALDDPKRAVRAAAAACRTHWYILGSGTVQ